MIIPQLKSQLSKIHYLLTKIYQQLEMIYKATKPHNKPRERELMSQKFINKIVIDRSFSVMKMIIVVLR